MRWPHKLSTLKYTDKKHEDPSVEIYNVCPCMCQRLALGVFFSWYPHYFVKQDLPVNLKLTDSAGLADQRVPAILLPNPFSITGIIGVINMLGSFTRLLVIKLT